MPDDSKVTDLQGGLSDREKKIYEHRKAMADAKAQGRPVGGTDMPAMPSFAEVAAEQSGRGDKNPFGAMTQERYDEMVKSGQAVPGIGGGFAVNQPLMQPGAQRKSPEERKAEREQELRALAAANKDAGKTPPVDGDVEDLVEDEEEEDGKEAGKDPLADLGPDMFSAYQVAMQQARKNRERREAIAARVDDIDIEQALVSQDITQSVPIYPGKFEVKFRSLNGAEDSWVKDYVWRETTGSSSDLYYQTRTGLLNLTMALVGVGGSKGLKPLLDHRDKDGGVDEEKAKEKLKFILKYPMPILMEMSIQYAWFEQRIREALDFDSVKNG